MYMASYHKDRHYFANEDMHKNILAARKGAALFKMASVKNVEKSKGAARKLL